MAKREIQWVNTPVLMEAITRYEKNLLAKPMRLWIEKLLDINTKSESKLPPKIT